MALRKGWQFCPKCARTLTTLQHEGDEYLTCSNAACGFIDWNNPLPVVAALIIHKNRESGNEGVVLVQRKVQPFVGRWCLPRGFLKSNENPKAAIVREVKEETGLVVLLMRILQACNPSPKNFPLNQMTTFYLASVLAGELAAGDDAQDVGVFAFDALPDICFASDVKLIAEWQQGVYGTYDQPVNLRRPRSSTTDGTPA